ncbi:MAG: adenosylmethionine decarboxylase [Elusimicrobia bacterium]|nr:adenosylmethionine decarboxylase [Elusimicrobiota bacterium]
MFFEGAEKKAELVVVPGSPSLRALGRPFWEGVVLKARAKVLSTLSNADCDAYLLSESSLFVWDERALLITCGRTTLVPAVLELVDRVGSDKVAALIYERKDQIFPEYQPTNFLDDARVLGAVLPGKAVRFGEEDEHHVCLFHSDRGFKPDTRDVTLEILMHGIDARARAAFFKGPEHTLEFIHRETGVRGIVDGFEVDDHVFEPTGYSLNALRGREYYTIHVTPQRVGSYVSFETNHFFNEDLDKVVTRVLDIFRPSSVDVLAFSRELDPVTVPKPYLPRRSVVDRLGCGYGVQFLSFFKPQSRPSKAQALEVPELSPRG